MRERESECMGLDSGQDFHSSKVVLGSVSGVGSYSFIDRSREMGVETGCGYIDDLADRHRTRRFTKNHDLTNDRT